MTPANALERLFQSTRAWRWRLLIAQMMRLVAAVTFISLGLGTLLDWDTREMLWMAAAVAVLIPLMQLAAGQGRKAEPLAIALHWNRMVPELHESAQLLLADEQELPPLQRIQKQRVARVVTSLASLPALPMRPLRQSLTTLAIVLAATFTLRLFVLGIAPDSIPDSDLVPAPLLQPEALHLSETRVRIRPPGYTGLPERMVETLGFAAEEGAVVRWEFQFSPAADRAEMTFAGSDPVTLEKEGDLFVLEREITEPAIYFVHTASDRETFESDFARIELTRDQTPGIQVSSPPVYSRFESVEEAVVQVEATVQDDYAVESVQIIATIGSGEGENIRFRESELRFDSIQRSTPRSLVARKRLSALDLGMEPGDELFFTVRARDNRRPTANETNSASYFLVIEDPDRLRTSIEGGLPAYVLPEYFRSQRQLIIDTEKLLVDRARISEAEFGRRSAELGLDQHALRLRYGQFLGLESESGDPTAVGESLSSANEIAREYGHSHDSSLEATFFSDSIKATLRASLHQMWESERRLRTHQPKESLPFQNRALDLLKEVQQKSRIYVQKLGFATPPLKVQETRLTGDLEEIATRNLSQSSVTPARDLMLEAWTIVNQLRESPLQTLTPGEIEVLEAAGRELAQRALEEPGVHLKSLTDLRELIATLRGPEPTCERCLTGVWSTLWTLLESPEARPRSRGQRTSPIGELYWKELESRQ